MSEPAFKRVELVDIAERTSNSFVDGPFGSSLKSNEYTEAGIRLIQLQNIGINEWNDDNKKFISEQKFLSLQRHGAVPGDIAIAKMADPVARACIVPEASKQFVVVADCIRLRPDTTKFVPSFVVKAINSPYTRQEAEKKAIGSTRIRINLSTLKTVGCLIPPFDHQSKIAEILDTLDAAIRGTQAVIAKLKASKHGLLHDLLTRGIDVRGNLRPRYPDAPHLYKETPLGWLPMEWDVLEIQDLLAAVDPAMRSGPFGSALLKEELVSHGIPFLGIDNVHVERFDRDYKRFVTRAKFLDLHRYAVRPDDLMITIMGTVGRCCLVPKDIGDALSSKHTWAISLDSDKYSPYLAMLQVNYSDWVLRHFSKDQQGGTMSAIRSDTIRSTRLPVPPREEQTAIESIVLELSERLREEEAILAKYRLQKSGLMNDLLTGRVSVTPLL
ncbi:restriction endonuclease subunit S [Neorhizobium alkalisoli]|uniref:Type I restriction enzyme S subunit n=1 Tax=Neorhizobium alkalisoli TaxID=528178 RepID=A0A561R274_9HYPH|nr:restriction endonuclease subunit S [Neorhizobium alkalisoli]TWF56712.1 type I restriction enzyme S subunit [Neorhizobium alkalisoli]